MHFFYCSSWMTSLNWCNGIILMDWMQKILWTKDGFTWLRSTILQMEWWANHVLGKNNKRQIKHHLWVWAWHILLKLVMVVKSSTPQVKCPTQRVIYRNMPIHIIWVNWVYVWQPCLKPMVSVPNTKHLSTQRCEVGICLQKCFKFFILLFPKWIFKLCKVGLNLVSPCQFCVDT